MKSGIAPIFCYWQGVSRQVKICGLTRPEDVAAAIRYGADYLGFIIDCPSKRRLSVDAAAALAMPAKGLAARVAVTVETIPPPARATSS